MSSEPKNEGKDDATRGAGEPPPAASRRPTPVGTPPADAVVIADADADADAEDADGQRMTTPAPLVERKSTPLPAATATGERKKTPPPASMAERKTTPAPVSASVVDADEVEEADDDDDQVEARPPADATPAEPTPTKPVPIGKLLDEGVSPGIRMRLAVDLLESLGFTPTAMRATTSRLTLERVMVGVDGKSVAQGEGDDTGFAECAWEILASRPSDTGACPPLHAFTYDLPKQVSDIMVYATDPDLAFENDVATAAELAKALAKASDDGLATHAEIKQAMLDTPDDDEPALRKNTPAPTLGGNKSGAGQRMMTPPALDLTDDDGGAGGDDDDDEPAPRLTTGAGAKRTPLPAVQADDADDGEPRPLKKRPKSTPPKKGASVAPPARASGRPPRPAGAKKARSQRQTPTRKSNSSWLLLVVVAAAVAGGLFLYKLSQDKKVQSTPKPTTSTAPATAATTAAPVETAEPEEEPGEPANPTPTTTATGLTAPPGGWRPTPAQPTAAPTVTATAAPTATAKPKDVNEGVTDPGL